MEKRQHKQKAVLMTEGPIWRCLLLFALPLMAGNLFQQLYNTVDSIVVGNFVGKEALAAVGSTDSVINTFIGFFSGMSTGAGVIISQYYGGKKEEKLKGQVQKDLDVRADRAFAFDKQSFDKEGADADDLVCGKHRHNRHCAYTLAFKRNPGIHRQRSEGYPFVISDTDRVGKR